MRRIAGVGALVIGLAAVNAYPTQSYMTEDFQIPEFIVKTPGNKSTAPGYLFFGTVSPVTAKLRGSYIADNDGELIWHGPQDYRSSYNFQTQMFDGKPQLSFWNGFLEKSGHGYGHVTVMDNTYQVTKTICFPSGVNIVAPRPSDFPGNNPNPCYIDKHESIVTNRNSIIVTAYNTTQTDLSPLGGPKKGWVYDCLFYELSLADNSVLFKWSALDHVDIKKSHFVNKTGPHPLLLRNSHVGNNRSLPWDYFHINSVEAVPGGYLVNSRMTWSMYMVNGNNGDIEWTLEGNDGGDFKSDGFFFSWQHHPRLQRKKGNNLQIHFFNNDNINNFVHNKNVSTGYMLNVNPKTKKATTIYNLHKQPFGPIYAVAEGSQQQLPGGHHLIGYGTKPFIEEYDGNNKLVYTAQYGDPHEKQHSYRVYRLPWVGKPAKPPKAVASQTTNPSTLTVFMSWNGATEYTKWRVYVGKTQDSLKAFKRLAPKKGFETKYVMTTKALAGYKYAQVEALDADGTSLGKSDVVEISDAA